MITGDHPATALTIAKQVGLVEAEETLVLTGGDLPGDKKATKSVQEKLLACRVFARVSPEQKLDLISLYQKRGDIVGMTGDGVNDAPALKKADIGIAMGQRGTQVAADTATMVLKNDSFKSIVAAIAQGRVIFENIRKFILFLLSCNLSEVLVVTFAGFLQVGNALLPLQILFINIVTDVFPALALGVGKENNALMQHPPRDPKQPLLSRADWIRISAYAAAMTVSVLGVYWYAIDHLNLSDRAGNTLVFYALSLAQLLHVFNLYSPQPGVLLHGFFNNEITRNRYIWFALAGCVAILALTYFVPLLVQVLSIETLSAEAWGLVLLGGFGPILLIQPVQALVRWRSAK
jgi:Ca2+-transporting ATPase